MKKILLLTFLLPLMILNAQITIDQNDMPKPGDTLRMSATNLIEIDYTKTGLDTTWDFSSLIKMGQQIDTFENINNVPPVYWLLFTPTIVSNLASPGSFPIPLPGFAVSSLYNFYKNSPGSFNYLGLAFQISGFPIMMKYDNPDVLYTFPCTIGTTWSSQSASSASIPGLGYYSTVRNRSSSADGWGTLITPYGSFQTIRVKSHWIEEDSIYLDTLGMGFPLTRDVTEYKWLAKNQGEPLLTITEEGQARSIVYRDIINHPGWSELTGEAGMVIRFDRMNETLDVKILDLSGGANFSLYDMNGKLVLQKRVEFVEGRSSFVQHQQLSPGAYLIAVELNGKRFSGKIIK